jgi:hypothetical protein
LNLSRIPVYLRFVVQGDDWGTLDALDLLEDHAAPGETIIAAKWQSESRGLACSRGKGGGCRPFSTTIYEPVECPLSQEQLADNAQWTQWCMEQAGHP